jgi:arsenate reductase
MVSDKHNQIETIIMAKKVYYHNPRCSKSRQGLAFLNENNVDIDIKEYLKVPLTKSEVSSLVTALGLENAIEMVRTKEAEFAQAGLSKDSSNSQIIEAIVKYPKLLERPILSDGTKAAIGRPLENFKSLLGL